MSTRYAWPTCTVPGCGHRHTWASQLAAQKGSMRHLSTWVNPDGTAVCYCHAGTITDQLATPVDEVPTFPCDVTQQATEHA
jgi:hypothetical protein